MEMNLLDDEGWAERTWPPEQEGFAWRRNAAAEYWDGETHPSLLD